MKLAVVMGDYERQNHFYRYVLLTTTAGEIIFPLDDSGSSAPRPPGWDIWGGRGLLIFGEEMTRTSVRRVAGLLGRLLRR